MVDLATQLVALGAATLGESGGHPMHPRLRPVWPGAAVAGPSFVVDCGPADNLAIHAAVAEAPAGSVLVVKADDPPERGYWGEVLTTGAEARGIAGLVIDGGVRDAAALARHGFPVFSALVALRGAAKVGGGAIGGRATIGDVLVETGDWVVGDADGVTVIPGRALDEVVEAGVARALKEERFFMQLREGATTVDLLGLDTSLVERRTPSGP
ncbi:MAG TPA: RraA family protein [Acidimicrobiales bacterium]|nr:RraA family protein [Acidimicrobiales bacterium]